MLFGTSTRALLRRLGSVSLYRIGRETHLVSSRDPGELDPETVLGVLLSVFAVTCRRVSNDNHTERAA
ncbi:hypothetical protein [Methylobacterium brachythecii]|uniref:Uncharacterized protein n=1 Tax=Methylobacterium brachythecii TaxID=1176177 RepID=A0A7W6F938_9HYPH|nr:hypothetical protein [Methylobacterium brachythecii]MBB3905089.1 hypothetical protein [Methylobacterium brachythecii]GLS44404.1 hypothetical protein GCM10007884_23920 [Methylobacterium brachythecii]